MQYFYNISSCYLKLRLFIKKPIIWFIILLSFLSSSSYANKEQITIYAYHLKPPYIISIEEKMGLYFDFSRYLNSKAGPYQFQTSFMPRKRIEIYLNRGELNGILIGVNPVWFKDKAKTKYSWTSTIFEDQDEVVSHAEAPVEYHGPKSLKGLSLGGVLGFYYFGITEAVHAGEIKPTYLEDESSVLQMLIYKRIDTGIVSRSTLDYLVKENDWQDRFHISSIPHDKYSRHILLPLKYSKLYKYIESIIVNINEDPMWQKVLLKYE